MSATTGWFIAGLVGISLGAIYAPRITGPIAILIVVVLAIRIAQKNIL